MLLEGVEAVRTPSNPNLFAEVILSEYYISISHITPFHIKYI